ncbi:cytochrome c oxidase assembly protein [Polycladomyces sp. WAk]|uniref:Cytochrome c oxidase assembly protein n=1 Tax=Polycladomyces zharkentensis TaxID=2807616 RepID=A0ABS2WLN4_9BACL|nr:cytochrome c oxidase assembly protein [Polycladomyces sp. WAk]MBN2910477.1 cytochrome c oxidase assembly protein [Polycladomyces sp. WAk]
MMHSHMHHAAHAGSPVASWFHWEAILIVLLLGIGYAWYTGPRQKRLGTTSPVPIHQKVWFYTGLVLIYVAHGSPLADWGHISFSVHMLQQSIMFLMMPPAILLGMPPDAARAIVKRIPKGLFAILTQPLSSILLFNLLFSLYHVPVIFDTLMSQSWYHVISHTLLILTAFMMWWPVVCPVPELDKLSELKKIAYIFANGILLTPACALIIFARELLYASYGHVQVFGFLPPIDDQQFGGVIMKIIQEIVYGMALGITFFRWVKKERAKSDEQTDAVAVRMRTAEGDGHA